MPSIVVNLVFRSSSLPFATAAALLLPAYWINSSGKGNVRLTEIPDTSVIFVAPVASYRLISIGKYAMLLKSPYFASNAAITAAVACASSVIFTTKLSEEPFTFAEAISVLEIPPLDTSTDVVEFLLALLELPLTEDELPTLKFALISTLLDGMVKVVDIAVWFTKPTPFEELVHLSNTVPSALAALIGTIVPAVYSPEPEPPFTTTLYFVPLPDTLLPDAELLLSPSLPSSPSPLPPPFPLPLPLPLPDILPFGPSGLSGLFGSSGPGVVPEPSTYTAKTSKSFVTFFHASVDHLENVNPSFVGWAGSIALSPDATSCTFPIIWVISISVQNVT